MLYKDSHQCTVFDCYEKLGNSSLNPDSVFPLLNGRSFMLQDICSLKDIYSFGLLLTQTSFSFVLAYESVFIDRHILSILEDNNLLTTGLNNLCQLSFEISCSIIDFIQVSSLLDTINGFSKIVSDAYCEGQRDFYDKLCLVDPRIEGLADSYLFNARHISYIRSNIQQVIQPLFSPLRDINIILNKIENLFKQLDNSQSSIRNGLLGGSIGAAIGSFIFPGIGTLIGAGLGGIMLNKNHTDNISSEIIDLTIDLLRRWDYTMIILIDVVRDLQRVLADIDYRSQLLDKGLFDKIQSLGIDAYSIFMNIITDIYKEEIDTFYGIELNNEEDPVTVIDAINILSDWINNRTLLIGG